MLSIRRKFYTVDTVATLRTPGQFRRAYARCRADSAKVNDAMIEAGRGHWRNAEREAAAADGDRLALLDKALCDEAYFLGWHAEQHFGQRPYSV